MTPCSSFHQLCASRYSPSPDSLKNKRVRPDTSRNRTLQYKELEDAPVHVVRRHVVGHAHGHPGDQYAHVVVVDPPALNLRAVDVEDVLAHGERRVVVEEPKVVQATGTGENSSR